MKLSQKALVILAVAFILACINVVKAECNLTVLKKKESAKTAYLGTVKLSGKILNALSRNCKLNVKTFTKEEFINMQIAALQRKLK